MEAERVGRGVPFPRRVAPVSRARILPALTLGLALAASAAGAAPPSTPPEFLRGGDVSMLPQLESQGAAYRDRGKPGDALAILTRHGANCFRVRLFVSTAMEGEVVQNLPYVIALGKRIKAAGASFLLDLHYSDTWADPGHQATPASWHGLDFDALERETESYTAGVMRAMKDAGCLPDIVQIGNEVTAGFLWPAGRLGPDDRGWDRFATLLRAAIRGARAPLAPGDSVRIMVHLDCGGNAEGTAWFFRNLEARGVRFDLVGLSYYPRWHGSLGDLRLNLRETAAAFRRPIVLVETAYPRRAGGDTVNVAWPGTPEGQARFLEDVIRTVRGTPGGLGQGVLWWYPESVPVPGIAVWKGGAAALFDSSGNALPALDAFARDAGDPAN